MVIVKPKLNTVFSIAVFLFLNFAVSAYMAWQFFTSKNPSFFHSATMVFTGALGASLLVKFLWNWKTVEAGKGKFMVKFPFRFKTQAINGKDMKQWNEETIKTWGGKYSELKIEFDDKKSIVMSKQEHDGYIQMIGYLSKNFKKLQKPA